MGREDNQSDQAGRRRRKIDRVKIEVTGDRNRKRERLCWFQVSKRQEHAESVLKLRQEKTGQETVSHHESGFHDSQITPSIS